MMGGEIVGGSGPFGWGLGALDPFDAHALANADDPLSGGLDLDAEERAEDARLDRERMAFEELDLPRARRGREDGEPF